MQQPSENSPALMGWHTFYWNTVMKEPSIAPVATALSDSWSCACSKQSGFQNHCSHLRQLWHTCSGHCTSVLCTSEACSDLKGIPALGPHLGSAFLFAIRRIMQDHLQQLTPKREVKIKPLRGCWEPEKTTTKPWQRLGWGKASSKEGLSRGTPSSSPPTISHR